MVTNTTNQQGSASKWLAVSGALITGVSGIAMAVYSVVMGEEMGGGALLAASALAFGLLASNLDKVMRPAYTAVQPEAANTVKAQAAEAPAAPAAVPGTSGNLATAPPVTEVKPVAQSAYRAGTQDLAGGMNVSHINGMLVIRARDSVAVADPDVEPITDREREVLALVADGLSNKEISEKLFIAERTVKNHLTSTMSKLRASDRTHAVVKAIRMGWLQI